MQLAGSLKEIKTKNTLKMDNIMMLNFGVFSMLWLCYSSISSLFLICDPWHCVSCITNTVSFF